MISHFFIDRPIFAAVISALMTLTGALALLALPVAQYPRITPPGVVISISYPGASAQEVADTVGAPIEGVEIRIAEDQAPWPAIARGRKLHSAAAAPARAAAAAAVGAGGERVNGWRSRPARRKHDPDAHPHE